MGLFSGREREILFSAILCVTVSCSAFGEEHGAAQPVKPTEPPPALTLPPVPATGKGDPLIEKAWHLAAMNVPEVWRHTKGSRNVTLAFVDSGIDYTHADLSPNLKWNAAEWPVNGQDKDHNGFIDDVIGWDFVKGIHLPFDKSGHGTFLAGLAAAVDDNGIGSAGVCPKCTLLPVRFIDGDGMGDTDDAIKAIEYAILMKASVINLSFSGEGYDEHLFKALQDAQARDILVVAAASNDGLDLDKEELYPAKFDLPNLVTVAASDPHDALWAHSNWGRKTVHFAAPGVDVLSIWREGPGGYDTGSGTSDAAAIVTGAAGLLRSAAPQLTAVQAVQVLMKTVRRSHAIEMKTKTGGVVDIAAAVRCATLDGLPCLKN